MACQHLVCIRIEDIADDHHHLHDQHNKNDIVYPN